MTEKELFEMETELDGIIGLLMRIRRGLRGDPYAGNMAPRPAPDKVTAK